MALSELEARHLAITEAFNRAWSERDVDALLAQLHDDVVYMVYEGGPVLRGPGEIRDRVSRFLARYARVEFEILRMHVIGRAVIHERTEHYYGPGGELDTRFHVVSVLVMRDDRIVLWRDYGMPGAGQLVGPLCRQ